MLRQVWQTAHLALCLQPHAKMPGAHKGHCLDQFSRSAVSKEVKGGFFSISGEFKDRLETNIFSPFSVSVGVGSDMTRLTLY